MLSVSTPGRHFFRPSRCLTCRLQGLGLARAPQRAFFNSSDNVAPLALWSVAEAGQRGLTEFLQATSSKSVVVDTDPLQRDLPDWPAWTWVFQGLPLEEWKP